MRARFAMLLLVACFGACGSAFAQVDISNPLTLMFVADTEAPLIDVIDLEQQRVVYRIETAQVVDDLIVTPYAPILAYTNIEQRTVTFFDLRSKTVAKTVQLPLRPRHMVLDTTGAKIGFTDSEQGGFALVSAYSGAILFSLPDFPPSRDVLFDPNDIDIYYSNSRDGSIGLIDTNVKKTVEIELTQPGQTLSAPSRSLDARYVYVANETTGEVYSLNAFSKVIYKTFTVGKAPARPYTTPEGSFLYMMDKDSGRFMSIEQFEFQPYADATLDSGVDLVTVGRFDRMNLLASSSGRKFYIYDNVRRSIVDSGTFEHTPYDTLGSADGRKAYVAFRDGPQVAFVDLESQEIEYLKAAQNGIGAFTIGLSNNVCH
jgi:DNA-binding beta-propeller fold protein YncE